VTDDRIEWHLENWANWMHAKPRMGFDKKSTVLASSSSRDFDEMCEEADLYAARATNAAIENLTPAEQAAIERKWDICGVWNFKRQNFLEVYWSGLKKLGPMLDAQGLV
jgi:hypothetical protein